MIHTEHDDYISNYQLVDATNIHFEFPIDTRPVNLFAAIFFSSVFICWISINKHVYESDKNMHIAHCTYIKCNFQIFHMNCNVGLTRPIEVIYNRSVLLWHWLRRLRVRFCVHFFILIVIFFNQNDSQNSVSFKLFSLARIYFTYMDKWKKYWKK